MFGNWFTDKASVSNSERNDQNDTTSSAAQDSTDSSAGLRLDVTLEPPESGTLPLNSPHDVAIDQIDQELGELKSSGEPGASSPPKLRNNGLPENVYDPFDGQSIGLMIPGEFDERENNLWNHLAEIRNLQSDIARMHAQMERLGDNDRFHGQPHTGDDEIVNAEDEAEAAKAAEFAKLTDRFNGRKEAIDAIMQKLQTLSNSINDFHSSRAPIFRTVPTQDLREDKKKSDSLEIVSSQPEDDPGPAPLGNRIRSASLEDQLKDNPVSVGRSPVDR